MTMTDDRNTLTMEQQAAKSLDWIEKKLRRLERLRELESTAHDQGSGLEAMLGHAVEEAETEVREMPYGVGTTITVEITLYGGGPAGGIEFECNRSPYGGLEWQTARLWHNDWFQPKGWVTLDNDTAQTLWDLWGLESLEVE